MRLQTEENIPQSVKISHYSLADRGAFVVLAIVIVVFWVPALAWAELSPAPTHLTSPSIEIRMLLGSALLSLLIPLVQIVVHIRRFGGPAVRGNRDMFPNVDGAAARIKRAHTNMIESLIPFAAIVLSAQVLGVSNRWTVAASILYLAARIVHAASYGLGITVVRSAAFYAGLIATVVIACQLPLF